MDLSWFLINFHLYRTNCWKIGTDIIGAKFIMILAALRFSLKNFGVHDPQPTMSLFAYL